MNKTYIVLNPKGYAHFKFEVDGIIVREFEKKNTVIALSKKIIARSLAGQLDAIIDSIRVYKDNALISSGGIYNKTVIDNEVEFSAIFQEGDFKGIFNGATLTASQFGDFSQLSGFTANKADNEKLTITWKIQIL